MGFIWADGPLGYKGGSGMLNARAWLAWIAFAFALYAGLTMVTNVPFYSFKDVSFKRSVPFIVHRRHRAGHRR